VALGHPLEHCLHKLVSDHAILDRGIDRGGTHTGNGRPLIEDVTADDAAIQLGNDDIIAWVGEPSREVRDSYLGRGRVWGKMMVLGNCLECLIADRPTPVGIVGRAQAECEVHRVSSHSRTSDAERYIGCKSGHYI
jgi:hypothetical protein